MISLPSSLYGKNRVHFTAGDHTCPRNLESVFVKALDTFGEVTYPSKRGMLIFSDFSQIQVLNLGELNCELNCERPSKAVTRGALREHRSERVGEEVGHPAAGGGRGGDQEAGQARRQVHGQAERVPGTEYKMKNILYQV